MPMPPEIPFRYKRPLLLLRLWLKIAHIGFVFFWNAPIGAKRVDLCNRRMTDKVIWRGCFSLAPINLLMTIFLKILDITGFRQKKMHFWFIFNFKLSVDNFLPFWWLQISPRSNFIIERYIRAKNPHFGWRISAPPDNCKNRKSVVWRISTVRIAGYVPS